MDADATEQRHPSRCHLQYRRKMVDVLGQLVEAEAFRNTIDGPRLGNRLEGPQHDLAGVFLVIGTLVRDAQHGQIAGHLGTCLADDIEMLTGLQGKCDTGHSAHLTSPHAGAVDHNFGSHRPLIGGDASRISVRLGDRSDADVLEYSDAAIARALRHGERNISWITLAVFR